MSDLTLLAAAGNVGGEGAYVEDVFSTHIYTGNGGSGVSGTQAQVIENGIALSDNNSGGSVEFGDGDSIARSGVTFYNDFTLECWFYKEKDDTSPYTLLFSRNNAAAQFMIDQTNSGSLSVYLGYYAFQAQGTAVTPGEWHHIAFTRNGSTCRGFVDGVLQGSGGNGNSFTLERVGNYNGSSGYDTHGYLLDVRWINGTSLYNSNFTPPTSPLTDVSGTVLLTCQPDNPTTDASSAGASLGVSGNPTLSDFGRFTSDTEGKGGAVWIKNRDATDSHVLYDTERGVTKRLHPNTTAQQANESDCVTSFNAGGFTLGEDNKVNTNNENYVSWTFAKQKKFFDIVTYTGTGSAQNISHNLGSTPGMIIVKCTSTTGNWAVWHRSSSASPDDDILLLNTSSSTADAGTAYWNNTSPTGSQFTVGTSSDTNSSDESYVAYIFAHNNDDGGFGENGDQDIIKCGGYTGTGAVGNFIDLGFEPQWVMIKRTGTSGADWFIHDIERGISSNHYVYLSPNLTSVESDGDTSIVEATATGFKLNNTGNNHNANNSTYAYVAIRKGPMKSPTSGTEVFKAVDRTNLTDISVYRNEIGFSPDMVLRTSLNKTSTAYMNQLYNRVSGYDTDGFSTKFLQTHSTAAEASPNSYLKYTGEGGFHSSTGWTSYEMFYWFFRRAPGFFDVVAWDSAATGDAISHNLGVKPELIIAKIRDQVDGWYVYHKDLGATKRLRLDLTAAESTTSNVWDDTEPTASDFTVGGFLSVYDYIAYLFATVPGISKVGSYTGNGTSQTIDCGFSAGARFVMTKRTNTTGNWNIWDSERGIVAGNDPRLELNTTDAEDTGHDYIDPDSSGFVVNYVADDDDDSNVDGDEYIFLAIA